MQISYRPEIDGLRAVSIVAVVLFHLGIDGFGGGYTGVDVFFVISGFLITSLIWKAVRSDSFSFRDFYARRARRILPVLFAVIAITYVIGLMHFWPVELEQLSRSALAAVAFVSNVYFWSQIGYFGPNAHDQPLLHTWTIGVEEQFYIVFPILLLAITRLRKQWVPPAIVLFLIAGFCLTAWAVSRYPAASFYLLQFRAWELLLGAALAVLPLPAAKPQIGSAAFIAGLIMVCLAAVLYTEATPIPGPAALLPCAGAALIIWSGPSVRDAAGRLLANPLMTGIGKISYSMYLWHWPMIVYLPVIGLSYKTLSTWDVIWFFVALLALSRLSYQFIEQPFRHGPLFASKWRPIAAGITVAGVMILCGLGALSGGYPQRLTSGQLVIYQAALEYKNGGPKPACFHPQYSELTSDYLEQCIPLGEKRPWILLWGDSVAAYQSPGLLEASKEVGVNVTTITKAGCRPIVGASGMTACDKFTSMVRDLVLERRPDLIVLSARWNIADPEERAQGKSVAERAVELAHELRSQGLNVAVLGPPVQYTKPLPQAILDQDLPDNAAFDTSKIFMRQARTVDDAMKQALAPADIPFISILDATCSERKCKTLQNRRPMVSDVHHLTKDGSEFLTARILPQIMGILGETNRVGQYNPPRER